MNRNHDLLLNKHFPNIKSIPECMEFLNFSLYDCVTSLPSSAPSSSLLALLTYLCGYATLNEFSFMIGPCFNNFFRAIDYNVRKGSLEKYALSLSDFGSRASFRLTNEGFSSYLGGISFSTEGGDVDLKKRTTARKTAARTGSGKSVTGANAKPIVPMHDYGVGISLLSLLSLRRGIIELKKEYEISSAASSKTSGRIRVDAMVRFVSDVAYSENLIYLEQDAGTEGTRKLINKFFAYGDSFLMDPDKNCIIMSCHAPSGLPADVFSPKAAKELYAEVVGTGFNDLYDFYVARCTALPVNERVSIESLLFRVGLLNPRERDAKGIFANTSVSFSADDLLEFAESMDAGNNPYYERSVNARLEIIAKNKFRMLCEGIAALVIYKEQTASHFSDHLLRGYSILVLPSTLLANSSHLFLRADDGFRRFEPYLKSIEGYYPNILKGFSFSQYGSFSVAPNENFDYTLCLKGVGPGGGDRFVTVSFANVFYSMTGEVICFEHLGRDIGAFVRLFALSLANNREDLNVHVIAVCDTYEDAEYFCRHANPMPFIKGKNGGCGFKFTFLFEQTVLEDGKSPLYEFNRPYNSVTPYLDPSYDFPNKPKGFNDNLANIKAYNLRNFL